MKGKFYINLNFLIFRAKRLSKLLLRNEMIISLNLSDNKIGYEGISYFGYALKSNTSL